MSKGKASGNYYLIPIVFFIAVIPLIVFMKVIPLSEIEIVNWTGAKDHVDFFSYYKSILIIAAGVIAIIAMVLKAYNNDLRIKRVNYYIPVAVYAIFVVLSTLLSQYRNIALNGFVDRYEGVYVIISYILLMFIAINFVENEKQVRILTGVLLASATVAGMIGIFQFIGFDLFKTNFGKLLILPQEYHYIVDKMNFLFGKYTIYSTMYNTNFVGSYMAMLFPISFVIFLAAKRKNYKVMFGLMTGLMFANWIGSRSRAGLVGGVLALILLIVLFRKMIQKNIVYFVSAVVVFVFIFISMNAISGGSLLGKYVSEVTVQGQTENIENPVDRSVDLKNIEIDGKKLSIVTATEKLTLSLEGSDVKFLDDNGNSVVVRNNPDGTITLENPRYSSFVFTKTPDTNIFKVDLGNVFFDILVQPEGFKIVGERGILLDKLQYPEKFGFEGNEKFASMRGYIWSRSIPLLKRTLLVGTGPDTFAIQFPQHDYVGKLRAFGKVNQIVDKPHNLYMQIGINTGVVSLVAILVLFAMYFISSIKIYFKNKYEDNISYLGLAMFLAFCGYATAGMFNDSLVSVAPVFWVILGMGIACNYLITKVKPKEVIGNKSKVLPVKKNAGSSGKVKVKK